MCFCVIEKLPPPSSPSLLCLLPQGEIAPLTTSKPSKQLTRCPASLKAHIFISIYSLNQMFPGSKCLFHYLNCCPEHCTVRCEPTCGLRLFSQAYILRPIDNSLLCSVQVILFSLLFKLLFILLYSLSFLIFFIFPHVYCRTLKLIASWA